MSEYSIVELIQTINHWHNLALLYVGRAVEDDHEELLEAIKKLIKNQPGVDKENIEKWSYSLEWKDKDELRNELIEKMLREAGIKIKE